MSKLNKIVSPGTISQNTYDGDAKAQRNSESGLSWTPVGAINAAVRVGKSTSIMIYNSAGAVGFVKFGAQAVVAPTTAANGIPILPNSIMIISSGQSDWIIGSAATLFAYSAELENA